MRYLSTEQSAEEGEPTIGAFFEMLLAAALSIAIAVRYHTLAHVAAGACFAPFLLLRSSESQRLGITWFNRFTPITPTNDNVFRVSWLIFRTFIFSLLIKVFATLSYPVKGVRTLPNNWFRIVLCTDFGTPVELVPGTGSVRSLLERCVYYEEDAHPVTLTFAFCFIGLFVYLGYFLYQLGELKWSAVVAALLLLSMFVLYTGAVLFYAVAYAFRFSLKATALIWLPLIYIVH